jgi:ubiquinone/menaquinone biosynthesis C-methylase UbiE
MISSKTPFDQSAAAYDADFTFSMIGRAQRDIVHEYLENNLNFGKVLQILELNCGTGEDALFFAKKGAGILATDVSEKMLEIAKEKVKSAGLENKICIKKLDTADLALENFEKKFDLIFSDFGGLNCISRDKLKELSGAFRRILNPSGRMIFIIMPSLTLWEIFYFSFKRNFKEAFRRRKRSGVEVKIKDSSVHTYYYSPKEIKKIFSGNFKLIRIRPVGFYVPPSYLENFFKKKTGLFQSLKKIERAIKNVSALSSFSDHFIIDLEARQ